MSVCFLIDESSIATCNFDVHPCTHAVCKLPSAYTDTAMSCLRECSILTAARIGIYQCQRQGQDP